MFILTAGARIFSCFHKLANPRQWWNSNWTLLSVKSWLDNQCDGRWSNIHIVYPAFDWGHKMHTDMKVYDWCFKTMLMISASIEQLKTSACLSPNPSWIL